VTGAASAALGNSLVGGQSLAAAQPEGARYAFHPDGPRKALGPDGGLAVGLAAGAVTSLLDAALRTGDRVASEAGLKGLTFMDRFDVPRAAQVWECPLHSPDILASGQACRAYLLGYRLTGDEKLLRRAIFWARTGLPFTYAWQAPDMPQLMKYSTIPIFGATFYTGSWFGVPVQWNGLDYAAACLDLAPYDPSFPWRQVAEGITVSGMNMQSTRDKDYGCYTDNWNLVTDTECTGCMLSPGGILSNVLRLMGTPSAAGVDGVRGPTGWIAVNGPGEVSGVSLQGGTLTASVRYFAGETGFVAIMPVTKPTAVTLDGKPLVFTDQAVPEVGQWRYDPRLGCVTLQLRFGAKPARVTVTGAQRQELVLNQTEWVFEEPGDPLGWTAANDLSQPVVAGGVLKMDITGSDPYCVSPVLSAAADKLQGLAVRLRGTKPGGQFYWATDAGGFSPARSASFAVAADGQFHDVFVDLTNHPEWRGTIRQVRVDFGGGKGDTAELQWVKAVPR
jgi:hypothetical protein